MRFSEINEQTEFQTAKPQLSQKLLRVNGEQRFYGFEFGNDLSVHDKIRSKGFIK